MVRLLEKRNRLSAAVWYYPREKKRFSCFRNDKTWALYCIAKDTIQDTADAIQFLLKKDFSRNSAHVYLELYGCFQAIVSQQDAIRAMYKIFTGEKLVTAITERQSKQIPLPEFRNWMDLRTIRNRLVGHACDEGGHKCYYGITRQPQTVSAVSISLFSHEEEPITSMRIEANNPGHIINLQSLITGYETETLPVWDLILQKAEEGLDP